MSTVQTFHSSRPHLPVGRDRTAQEVLDSLPAGEDDMPLAFQKGKIVSVQDSILAKLGHLASEIVAGLSTFFGTDSAHRTVSPQREAALGFIHTCTADWHIKGSFLPSGRLDESGFQKRLSIGEVRAAVAEWTVERAIGKTLTPQQAWKLRSSVRVDHTGRILGPRRNANISAADMACIQQLDIIHDLGQTNARGPRDVARTNREILLECVLNLRSTQQSAGDDSLPARLEKELCLLWLGNEVGTTSVVDRLHNVAHQLQQSFPDLARTVAALAKEAACTRQDTQLLDNMFGRKFEAEFVHALVSQAPSGIIDAANSFASFTCKQAIDHFDSIDSEKKKGNEGRYRKMVKTLFREKYPWHAEVPQVATYLANPSRENFIELFNNHVRSGYGAMLQAQLCMALLVSLPELSWRGVAEDHYSNVVIPARSAAESSLNAGEKLQADGSVDLAAPIFTRNYGPGLLHHPVDPVPENWTAEKSVMATRRLDFDHMTSFEKNMLTEGHSIVSGVSGTTNLLTFLFRHISQGNANQAGDPDFNISDAFAAVMTFVTFSGGHTLPECIATYESIMVRDEILVDPGMTKVMQQRLLEEKGTEIIDKLTVNYRKLPAMFTNPETREAVQSAIATAMEKTVAAFDKAHNQRMEGMPADSLEVDKLA